MKVNYDKFISELAVCVKAMEKGERFKKTFNLLDEDCGYNIVVNVEDFYGAYQIIVNGKRVYYTTKNACIYNELNEFYKILDIITAVNKFIR